MHETTTFDAALDIREIPAEPQDVISASDAAQEPVTVRCLVAARLVAVGDGMEVTTPDEALDGGWAYQRFTDLGVVEWAWSVEPLVPEAQQLRLELRPAAEGDDVLQVSSSATARYVTTVEVDASVLQRVWYWFETDWKLLTAVAGVVGAALIGLLQFSTTARDTIRKVSGRPRPSGAASEAAAEDARSARKDASRGRRKRERAASRR
jgi:hypothetical protein